MYKQPQHLLLYTPLRGLVKVYPQGGHFYE
nr:MAG TPA: hypothetical protein [Bacteriophage sp.]